MRRGDLTEYPAEWVLRAAADERLTGGIEFHTATPVRVHVANGDIYLALPAGDPGPDVLADDASDDAVAEEERTARRLTVATLRDLLAADPTGAWYFFHPLDHHPLRGAWRWRAGEVLAEASRPPEVAEQPSPGPLPAPAQAVPGVVADGAAPALAGGRVAPATHAPDRPLDAEAWAVLTAMVEPAAPAALAARLGWSRARLDRALAAMAAAGVLGPPIRADEGHQVRPPAGPRPTPAVPRPLPVARPALPTERPEPLAAPRPVPVAVPLPVDPPRPPALRAPDAPTMDAADDQADEPDAGVKGTALRRLIRSLRAAS